MNIEDIVLSLSKEDFKKVVENSYSFAQVARKLGLSSTGYLNNLLKERIYNESINIEHFKTGSVSTLMNFDKKEFKKIIEESVSYSDVLRKCNLKITGGNLKTLKKRINTEQFDCNHFETERYRHKTKKMSLEEILVKNSPYKSTKNLKERLIKEGILENKCNKCGTGPEWQGEPLSLELDHIDGDNRNNLIENLRILCPNCHSQTETFGGKNIKKERKVHHCVECNAVVYRGSEICINCANRKRRKIDRPSKVELLELILDKSVLDIAKIYNVSDNAVRKWCKEYDLPIKKKDILLLKLENGLPVTDNTSGFIGVLPHKDKWKVAISINNKNVHIGIFTSPKEAAEAYDKALLEHQGEHALTNKSLGLI